MLKINNEMEEEKNDFLKQQKINAVKPMNGREMVDAVVVDDCV